VGPIPRLAGLCLAAALLGLPAPARADAAWDPPAGISWQWQLSGKLDTSVDAAVYDIDVFDTSATQVATLQAKGRRVICYLSAGSWESFRPDADQIPSRLRGRRLDGYPDERWLDIRDIEGLRPVMEARLDQCRSKGFDGVEPDNVDGYANDTGFPLTAADQLAYNRFLASEAHERGLAVGLKNDLDQADELEEDFDFAVNEQCFQYKECGVLTRFISADKPVFHVEYKLRARKFCPKARALGFSSMKKRAELDAWRKPC
jgi:hypothetical protein